MSAIDGQRRSGDWIDAEGRIWRSCVETRILGAAVLPCCCKPMFARPARIAGAGIALAAAWSPMAALAGSRCAAGGSARRMHPAAAGLRVRVQTADGPGHSSFLFAADGAGRCRCIFGGDYAIEGLTTAVCAAAVRREGRAYRDSTEPELRQQIRCCGLIRLTVERLLPDGGRVADIARLTARRGPTARTRPARITHVDCGLAW